MASRKIADMKVPVRAAPPPPVALCQKQTSWKEDLFSNDPFSDGNAQKKKPPPRPPPPRVAPPSSKPSIPAKPDVPQRPSHFNRKPTILSNIMSRAKGKSASSATNNGEFQTHVALPPPSSRINNDAHNNISSLIDFNSPPSSPTLTTRSSSDGLSVDSFGSDITSSTGHGNTPINGGNMSQAESGFEDDFDIFSSKSGTDRDTPQDSWSTFDPFSPPQNVQKPKSNRPLYDSDFLDPLCNGKTVIPSVQIHKLPTIIRAKPARPKTPKNSTLLSNTLNSTKVQQQTTLTNYSTIQEQIDYNGDSKLFEDGDYSPPMPNIPPPPPPPVVDPQPPQWNAESLDIPTLDFETMSFQEEPYGIALYDFQGSHEDDLPFRVNDKIRLLRKLDEEWMYGRLRSGIEGTFPVSYIEICVPLPDSESQGPPQVTALYDFVPQEAGDMGFSVGDKIKVLWKVSEEWLYGEIGTNRGQFPANYVDHIPSGLATKPPS